MGNTTAVAPYIILSVFTHNTATSHYNALEFFRKRTSLLPSPQLPCVPNRGCRPLGVCSLYFYPPPCDSVWPAAALWWLWLVSPTPTSLYLCRPVNPRLVPLILSELRCNPGAHRSVCPSANIVQRTIIAPKTYESRLAYYSSARILTVLLGYHASGN